MGDSLLKFCCCCCGPGDGAGGEGDDENRRIIVVSFGTITVGMIVDKVSQVIKINAEQISPTPDVVKGFDSDYISGVARVGERLIILLELERLFAQRLPDEPLPAASD